MPVSRYVRRIALALIDAAAVCCAFGFAYALGVAFESHPPEFRAAYLQQYLRLVVFLVALRVGFFALFGLYRRIVRYTGVHEMLTIAGAIFPVTLLLAAFSFVIWYFELSVPGLPTYPQPTTRDYTVYVPPRAIILEAMLTFLFVGGLRLSWRLLVTTGLRGPRTGRNLLIIGVETTTDRVCRELVYDPESDYRPVAIIDPGRTHVGGRLHGVPIVGGIESLEDAITRYGVEEILIAVHEASPDLLRRIVAECEKTRVAFKQLPSLADLMAGKVTVSQLRPVEIEDLLGRPAVELSLNNEQNYLRGECVLVTGAGGSIGSELCRQLARFNPAMLVLLERDDSNLFYVENELRTAYPKLDTVPFLGDITREADVNRVFQETRPNIVFHAAAYKHVPILEFHPAEAIRVNVQGSHLVAAAAVKYGAESFVYISTDKAVNPGSVMGASKRIGETVTMAMNGMGGVRFLAVRFGNVLDSRGSVSTIFRDAIVRRQPVTITHPDMRRYMMLTSEAVLLVMQAVALGKGGEVFILDMGNPVRIKDLAETMIRHAGLRPGIDIPIIFTGRRPGEKLFEELLTAEEGTTVTVNRRIYRACTSENHGYPKALQDLGRLDEVVRSGDTRRIRAEILRQVSSYKPDKWSLEGRPTASGRAAGAEQGTECGVMSAER